MPVGGGVGKMFSMGKLPADILLHYYNYVEAPVGGPDWAIRLQLKFIFPKK